MVDTEQVHTYANLVVTLLNVWDMEVVGPNSRNDVYLSSGSIHVCELVQQTLLKRLDAQPDVSHGRAHALHALGLNVSLRRGAQVLRDDVQVRRAEQCSGMVQCAQACELVCGARDLERLWQGAVVDCVGRAVRVARVGCALLVALVENNVVSLVDPGAVDAQLAEGAHHHLGMLVPGEVVARARNAPIEVARIVEDSAASRAAAHEVYGAVLGGVEDAQVDLCPRVLVAANDDARPVHVEKEHSALWRRLPQYVVLNREVQVRVVAGRDVALQPVLRVRQRVCKGRKAPGAAKPSSWCAGERQSLPPHAQQP